MKTPLRFDLLLSALLAISIASCTKSTEQVDQRVATLQAERDQLAADLEKARDTKADIDALKFQMAELLKGPKASVSPTSQSSREVEVFPPALKEAADAYAKSLKEKLGAQGVEAHPGAKMVPLLVSRIAGPAVVESYFKRNGDKWEPVETVDQLADSLRPPLVFANPPLSEKDRALKVENSSSQAMKKWEADKQKAIANGNADQNGVNLHLVKPPITDRSSSEVFRNGIERIDGEHGDGQIHTDRRNGKNVIVLPFGDQSKAQQSKTQVESPPPPKGGGGSVKKSEESASSSNSGKLPDGAQPIQGENGDLQYKIKKENGKDVIQLPFGAKK